MRCLTNHLRPRYATPGADLLDLMPAPDKRKDGNTQKNDPKPQQPKSTRKGGSPDTIRKP